MRKPPEETDVPNSDSHQGSEALTTNILKKIDFSKVIYAERTEPGGMGNDGGIIIDILENNNLTRYETNYYDNPELAKAAHLHIIENKDYFESIYAGMGNRVFVKKGIKLIPHEIKKRKERYNSYFIYEHNSSKYKITSSVFRIFEIVRAKQESENKSKMKKGLFKNLFLRIGKDKED